MASVGIHSKSFPNLCCPALGSRICLKQELLWLARRASRLSGGGRFRICQQSNVKGRLGYCAAGGIVGKRVTWERYEGGKGWNCERHKRFLWINSHSIPWFDLLKLLTMTTMKKKAIENPWFRYITSPSCNDAQLTLLFPAYFWTRFTRGGANLPPPIKCPIMGGRFQNWVGTSYLTEIDARQKDLPLSDT